MTKRLSTYLELANSPDNSRKHELIAQIPAKETTWHNGKVANIRELLQSEGILGTTLVPSEVLSTVLAGAEPAKCMREILPVLGVTGNSVVFPKNEAGTYADEVAQGAEIPVDVITYGSSTVSIKKFGVRPLITRELIDDGLWDMVGLELEKAGLRLENRLNQDALSAVLQGSGLEHDTAGTNQGIKAISSAYALVLGQNYIPDAVVMHPAALGIVMQDFLPVVAQFQVGDTTTTGKLPQILGMKSGVCGVTDTSASWTWGYAADSNIGMLVMDAVRAGVIAMRRDISVEQYDDPIRDLHGASVTMRYGVSSLQANAACRIEY